MTRWADLAGRVGAGLFLAPLWIRTAIRTAASPLYVFEARRLDDPSGSAVGLGLLSAFTETRHQAFRVRQLRLHETGAAGGSVASEENGLLCAPGDEGAVWSAFIKAVRAPGAPPWDEIVIANADAGCEASLRARGLRIHRRAEASTWIVDLAALRARGVEGLDGFVSGLGKNTRGHIRRTLRLYEEEGAVTLTRAAGVREALAAFEALGVLHEEKWRALGKPGLMSSPHLLEFHRALIHDGVEAGAVELLCASAGGKPFGWLYNLIDGDAALYYMGGFARDPDNRYKPGLLTHALAIADHLAGGRRIYDFMVGDERYKENLGEAGRAMTSFAIQAKTPLILLEAGGRWARARLASIRAAGGKAAG